MNEYNEAYRRLASKGSFKSETWTGERQRLVDMYAWGIPTDAVLSYIASFAPVQELGAGSGYWAYELRERGARVRAIDIDADPVSGEAWSRVVQGDESLLDGWPLLLVWPPMGESMAYDALCAHRRAGGSDVFYVGEWRGCTANERFHRMLEEEYECVCSMDIPSYNNLRDAFYHYRVVGGVSSSSFGPVAGRCDTSVSFC